MLAGEKQGRHRYYRLATPEAAAAIEALMAVAATGPKRHRPTGPKDEAMRAARTCYDHLAGQLAVALADMLSERGHLVLSDGATHAPADAPDDGVPRIDLGSIRLPAIPGMDLRVELNQQQKVIAATLRAGESTLQVSAFAAPRADGIWDGVREDLATSASGQGGRLQEVEGPFGTELSGTIMATPPPQPGQTTAPQPVRRPSRAISSILPPMI